MDLQGLTMPKGRFGLFHTTENITAAYNKSALNLGNAAKMPLPGM